MRQMVRNRAQEWLRRSVVIFVVFLLAFFMGDSVSAEEDGGVLGSMFAYEADGTSLGGTPAVSMRLTDDLICVCAGASVVKEGASYYTFFGEQEYEAKYAGMDADVENALFVINTDTLDAKFLVCESAYEGERVSLHYLSRDSEQTERKILLTVTGYKKVEESYYILDWTAVSQADLDEMYEVGFFLPGAVLNDAGQLVGIVTESGYIITYYLDENLFSGSAESPSEGSTSPGGSDSSGGMKGREDEPEPTAEPTPEPTAEPTPEPTAEPTPEPTAEPTPPGPILPPVPISVLFLLLVIGGVAVTAIVVAVLAVRKQPPVPPLPPVPADDDDNDIILPVPPLPPVPPIKIVVEEPKQHTLYLCFEGGMMDGRSYPVTADGLLIGRDSGCNICYPPDTKGISRKHCRLFWSNGVLMIMDLGSTSGTFVRGKGQISPNVPVAVVAGDTFYLGEKKNAFTVKMG